MTIRHHALACLSALGMCISHAHAATQTWALTASTYLVEPGFAAPAYAQLGQTFTIHYLFDTSAAPSPFGLDSVDYYAIEQITVGGQTSDAGGYIWTGTGGLNAINASIDVARQDQLDFVSFNNRQTQAAANVPQALANFSQAVLAGATDVRLDFGNQSVWATPKTFLPASLPAVPEPATAWSLLLGLAAIAVAKRAIKG